MKSLSIISCIVAGFAAPSLASAAPHPFHDDGGTVNWKWSLAAAQETAKRTGKPILIEACRESCGICKQMAGTTFKDAKTNSMMNRHFIPFVVDVDNAPPEITGLYDKVKGMTLPFIMFVTEKGEFVQGSSGFRAAEELRGDMVKVLGNKAFILSKKNEAELTKQTESLAKLLEARSYSKASASLAVINKIKGYSSSKDKAYDLLDAAQADAAKKVTEAVKFAEEDEYAKARESLSGIAKEYAGLPIADQVKDELAAIKLLETAHQNATAKKGPGKMTAAQQLTTVIDKYGDTPFAALALKRKKELAKDK